MSFGRYLNTLKAMRNPGRLVQFPPSHKTVSIHQPLPKRKTKTIFSIFLSFFIASSVAYSAFYASQNIAFIKEKVFFIVDWFKPDYSKKNGQVLVSRGNALRAKGQFKKAETAYHAAIGKFTLKENFPGLGGAHTELGVLHTRAGKYKTAKVEFKKAVNYFDLVGNLNGLGYANINLAQLHLIRRYFKSAQQHFLTAQQHYKAAKNLEGLGNVALGMGNLFLKMKNYPKAKKYFLEAESRFKSVNSKRGLVNVYNSLSRALKNQGPQGRKEAAVYQQIAKAIQLDTRSRALPDFSIRESFSYLTSIFNESREVYEVELNRKAKLETEGMGR